MKHITIGTRASKLAMIQTHTIVKRLRQQWPNLEIEIEQIRTMGDRVTNIPLSQIGGDGVFVTEIEHALRDGRVDLAVHSLKDLPTVQPGGLRLVVVGPREDVRDVLISNGSLQILQNGQLVSHCEQTVRIGTGSLRRIAQLRALLPTVEILPLRGNVDTRLRKVEAGEYDGIILAAAGVHRLGFQERLANCLSYFPVESMLPAPGQGAIALEIRDEPEMQTLLAPLKDIPVQAATSAERMFMRRLGAGCYLPVAAYASFNKDLFTLAGLVTSLDGQRRISVQQSIHCRPEVSVEYADRLGVSLAEQALEQGAQEIIDEIDTLRIQERQHV